RFHTIPGPGEPGHESWKDKNNAWQTGGGAFYVTGSYDPVTNTTYWGSGNPSPKYDSSYRPGDNLYTNSALALDAATGKLRWYHQYTPNDTMDYDESGSHILIDTRVNGEDRKTIVRAARNGFVYSFDRLNGQFLKATQYVSKVTWTKGIDPKTGKPVDYDPNKDLQTYAEPIAQMLTGAQRAACAGGTAGTSFSSPVVRRRPTLRSSPDLAGWTSAVRDQTRHARGHHDRGSFFYDGRMTSHLVVYDPSSGEVKVRKEMPYPNAAGALATGGGLIFPALLHRTIRALRGQTLGGRLALKLGRGNHAPPST